MPSFALRFVGQEALPSRLSEFDRKQFFPPPSIAALRSIYKRSQTLLRQVARRGAERQ